MTIRDGDAAVITVDNPPVNALGPGVPEGICSGASGPKDPRLKAIVLIGGGRTFIAGADIKEFGKITSGQKARSRRLGPCWHALEDCPKPVVVRHSRHGVWRRPGNGHGLPLPRGGGIGPGGSAGSEAGHHSRRRRHAALPRLAGVAMAAEMCAAAIP